MMHFQASLKANTTWIKSYQNERFLNNVELKDPNPPFPFELGKEFSMKITATTTNTLQVSNCWVIYLLPPSD